MEIFRRPFKIRNAEETSGALYNFHFEARSELRSLSWSSGSRLTISTVITLFPVSIDTSFKINDGVPNLKPKTLRQGRQEKF